MEPLAQNEFSAVFRRGHQNRVVADTMKDDNPPLGSPAIERDKKTMFWMSGVFDCFSSVWSLFKTDYREFQENDWEIPFELITDMTYLGSGAQSEVFSGVFNGEIIAAKKLKDKREASIKHLRKINHENIVRFRGVSTLSQSTYLIMEYCQYGTLFKFLHSGVSFHQKQILQWAVDIARGMRYLHTHKIIHRDLKSPNVLIADNLVAKVSDFGTSLEWNDVSTIMSFTGTVAWMAPEVIRHELCSERVDVWSYGVVIWELLTQEIPYRNLEVQAIMWGVGTDTIALPIPSTCPSSIQLLLNQCWNRVPRNRPPFKIIAAHLEMVAEELCSMDQESFNTAQVQWRQEIQSAMENIFTKSNNPQISQVEERREDFNHVRDARDIYAQQISLANELYMEACAVRLQLEQKERIIAEKEKALSGCRCGIRKNFNYFTRETSSSSDGVKEALAVVAENSHSRKKKHDLNNPAQLVVTYVGDQPTTSKAVAASACRDESIQNNNVANVTKFKDTIISIVEDNGNVIVKDIGCNIAIPVNDNYVPDLAHV